MSIKISNLEAAQLNKELDHCEDPAKEKKDEEKEVIVEMRLKKGKDDNKSARDSVISMKHYDNILCDLRCPGCSLPLYVPIMICCAGHSICQKCEHNYFILLLFSSKKKITKILFQVVMN